MITIDKMNSKMNNIDCTIGLETLEKKIGRDSFSPFEYELGENDDITLHKTRREEFVTPVFSVSNTLNCEHWEDANIILIEAVGASGKSWLCERLSYDLKCPVINLGKMSVVASYSLTGVINKRLGARNAGDYIECIQEGKMGLVIDALDEGFQKTNTDGYFDFLNDVIDKVPHEGSMPIVLLGRTNAVELAALHIYDKGLKVAILTIEPFTIEKACEFIDKRVCKKKGKENIVYEKTYKELRNYIIKSIECFFENQSAINRQKTRFMGYAPVLLATSDYINGANNYQKELVSLQENNNRSITLIIEITERILKRDKQEKIDELLLKQITSKRDHAFQQEVLHNVYLPEEQCARVLYAMLGRKYEIPPTNDEDFNAKYNEKINEWINEHPFLRDRQPANIVFESYILAKLAMTEQFKKDVLDYLSSHSNNSYIFFYIFNTLHRGKDVELLLIPHLYSSLNSLDAKNYRHSLDLSFEKVREDGRLQLLADFDDITEGDNDFEYTVIANANDELIIDNSLSNANIDVPFSVRLCRPKTELIAPLFVSCKTLIVGSTEIIVSGLREESDVIIDAEHIKNENIQPSIRIFGVGNNFKLICPNALPYPYSDFYTAETASKLKELSDKEQSFYLKMRRTLIMFRSHSKGKLAKCCSKIDNRIGRTESGKPVLNALITKGIIYKEGIMYFINLHAMNEHLGVSFDGIKECVVTDKIKDFISSIKVG